jgi:hypothetical protein
MMYCRAQALKLIVWDVACWGVDASIDAGAGDIDVEGFSLAGSIPDRI